jgi:hypothetical protein
MTNLNKICMCTYILHIVARTQGGVFKGLNPSEIQEND